MIRDTFSVAAVIVGPAAASAPLLNAADGVGGEVDKLRRRKEEEEEMKT